jgi:membrane-associated protein
MSPNYCWKSEKAREYFMEYIKLIFDFIMHIDVHLSVIIQNYGLWTYLILFIIIFWETGVVIFPFVPGDSLLFAVGAFSAIGALNVWWVLLLLASAAIIGDTVNYWIGHFIGPKIFHKENVRFLKKKHLESTHKFFEKYGGKTIIIARFIPIIRTFAPFVAGIGAMSYWKFISYNVIGGFAWVAICLFAGYLFGNLPVVKNNFTLVIFAIIIISVMPAIIEFFRHRYQVDKNDAQI